jgi:hypothetical protein
MFSTQNLKQILQDLAVVVAGVLIAQKIKEQMNKVKVNPPTQVNEPKS